MRLNTAVKFTEKTHEGAPAARMNPEQALRRSVLSCLLWESEFYEDGEDIAKRILDLSAHVPPQVLAALAMEARSQFNLRHVPLLLLKALVKHGNGRLVADAICNTIQRADELAEFLSVYWQDGKKPLSNPMRKGLAKAFLKFNAYQLAKYNRPNAVKLRDVLFLCHAKPDTEERAALWKQLVDGTLAPPDTWESALVSGKDKKETFERLLKEGNLGYLALLRNLRGMAEVGVDLGLVREAIVARKGAERVLPFRFVAAARACPQLEPELDQSLVANIAAMPALSGQTIVLVDVSGSMDAKLSARSDMMRIDAAATLASIINGQCRVFSFSEALVECPPRKGMSGVDAIVRSQHHSGTYLGAALARINTIPHDRIIIITDEQSHDAVPAPQAKNAYMINVASNKNGVGYGRWTHLDGFSEGVIRFIHEIENNEARHD